MALKFKESTRAVSKYALNRVPYFYSLPKGEKEVKATVAGLLHNLQFLRSGRVVFATDEMIEMIMWTGFNTSKKTYNLGSPDDISEELVLFLATCLFYGLQSYTTGKKDMSKANQFTHDNLKGNHHPPPQYHLIS